MENFISVITSGEIQHGIERLPNSRRKTELLVWMNIQLLQRFGDRMMAIDAPTMLMWGTLVARLEAAGKPVGVMDALLSLPAR